MGTLGLGSEPHVVGRLGSGPRVVGRLWSRVQVSGSFQIFALTAGGKCGEGNCAGWGNIRGNMSEGGMSYIRTLQCSGGWPELSEASRK